MSSILTDAEKAALANVNPMDRGRVRAMMEAEKAKELNWTATSGLDANRLESQHEASRRHRQSLPGIPGRGKAKAKAQRVAVVGGSGQQSDPTSRNLTKAEKLHRLPKGE